MRPRTSAAPRRPFRTNGAASLALFAVLLAGGCAAHRTPGAPGSPPPAATAGAIVETWGVEITGVRISAAGYVVDFRYRVQDPGKSAPLFVRKTQPVLIQQATGKELPVYRSAKVGPMRSSYAPKKDRVYTILFANNGRVVKAGDKVTVRIGDFVISDLVVE